jgi:hypothetical protein
MIVRSLIVGQDTDEGDVASPQVPHVQHAAKECQGAAFETKDGEQGHRTAQSSACVPQLCFARKRPHPSGVPPYSDEEADAKRFGTLRNVMPLRIVNLFTAPDLGLCESGNGEGTLAGALPSAETVLSGFAQITPQLVALGYATGKSLVPNHKGAVSWECMRVVRGSLRCSSCYGYSLFWVTLITCFHFKTCFCRSTPCYQISTVSRYI